MSEITNQDQTQTEPLKPLPAVQQPSALDLFGADLALMKSQAEILVASGLLPKAVNSWEKAVAIIMRGKELDIPPMVALSRLYIVDGIVTMSAELMLTMIRKNCPSAVISFIQNDNEACRICVERPGAASTVIGFSIDDARRANLTYKDNWKKYPRAMLRSRAVSEMARAMFPEAMHGISYTPEEISDNVKLDASGEVIDVVAAPENKKEAQKEVRVAEPSVEKVNSAVINPLETTMQNESEDPWKRIFKDEPQWWAWLDKKMAEFHIAPDFKPELSQLVVGREAGIVLKLLHDVAKGEDNPLLMELF